MLKRVTFFMLLGAAMALGLGVKTLKPNATAAGPTVHSEAQKAAHRTVKIDGLDIFYREAGPRDAPTVLLLHGFPTSSHMFRNLIPVLADRFHVVAPDYPGFGNSSMPAISEFDYTFDNFARITEKFTEELGLSRYTLYLQDYGAPVGFRLAVRQRGLRNPRIPCAVHPAAVVFTVEQSERRGRRSRSVSPREATTARGERDETTRLPDPGRNAVAGFRHAGWRPNLRHHQRDEDHHSHSTERIDHRATPGPRHSHPRGGCRPRPESIHRGRDRGHSVRHQPRPRPAPCPRCPTGPRGRCRGPRAGAVSARPPFRW